MAFRNQPLAGNYLVRAAIQSINYVGGVSGWTINRDGSAEFNSVTIRGATTSQGVSLYYNGAPAAGNMVASIAPVAGTDAYGNSYPQGIATYDGAGIRTGLWNLGQLVCTDPVSLGFAEIVPTGSSVYSPTLAFAAGGASTYKAASVNVQTDTTDTNQPLEILTMAGPSSVADAHRSYTAIQQYAGGTAIDSAKGYLEWFNNSVSYYPLLWSSSGIAAIGTLYGAQPGSSPAVSDSWHSVAFAGTWHELVGNGTPSGYIAQGDRTILLKGVIGNSNAALASGSTIGTLPAGYRPAQSSWFPCTMGGPITGQLNISTAGVISLYYAGGPLNQPTAVLDGVRFTTF